MWGSRGLLLALGYAQVLSGLAGASSDGGFLASVLPKGITPTEKHPTPAWMNPHWVTWFPNAQERQAMTSYEHIQRDTFFGLLFFVMMVVCVVVAEVLVCFANRSLIPDYELLAETSPRGSGEQPHEQHSGYYYTDVFFAWYKTTYEFFCVALVGIAFWNRLIDSDFGMDFEIYLPWYLESFFMHFVSIFFCIWYARQGKFVGKLSSPAYKMVSSVVPFFSERWNLLRDFITIGIYLSEGNLVATEESDTKAEFISDLCASIVALSLIICAIKQLGSPALMKSQWKTYWSISAQVLEPSAEQPKDRESNDTRLTTAINEEKEYAGPAWWLFLLKEIDKVTVEHKRISTTYGEVPQAVASVIFMYFTKFSHFVLLCLFIYVFKMCLLFLVRPWVLCFLADAGEHWHHVTKEDLKRILKKRSSFQNACAWEKRARNAALIVDKNQEHPDAIAAALVGLGNLYSEEDDDDDRKTEYVMKLRNLMQTRPLFKRALKDTLMKLCPGLSEKDVETPVPVSGGSLGYVPTGVALNDAKALIQKMRTDQPDWRKLLEEKNALTYSRTAGTNPDELMICFSDLEPDDSMAIAQLWQWHVERSQMARQPMVIYGIDFAEKEKGTVFEKKVMMTQLMLGNKDFFILSPDKKFIEEQEKKSGEPPKKSNHPKANYWEGLREKHLDEICKQLAGFEGKTIHFYAMAPGRGNLAAIVDRLRAMNKWPLPGKTWKISLYSGQFNMKGMSSADIAALKEIGAQATQAGNPLLDAAKFPFFGGKDCHQCTSSFTTFAPETFASQLNLEANPLLIAFLKLLNDEHNKGLVAPEKLYKSGQLSDAEKARLDRFRDKYDSDEPEAIQEYCKGIVSDFVLYSKAPDFKKSIIAAFAFNCADSPLCDQLIFLQEYMMVTRRSALAKLEPGSWNLDEAKGFTSVKIGAKDDTQAIQPILKSPLKEADLEYARNALQEYLLRHIRSASGCTE